MTGKIGDDAARWCWPLSDDNCVYVCGNSTACTPNLDDTWHCDTGSKIIDTQCRDSYWCDYDYYYPYGYSSWNSYCYTWTPWAVVLWTVVSLLLVGACICMCIMWSRGGNSRPPTVHKKQVVMQTQPGPVEMQTPSPNSQPAKRRPSQPMTREQQATARQPQNSYAPDPYDPQSQTPSAQVSHCGSPHPEHDPLESSTAVGITYEYGDYSAGNDAPSAYPNLESPATQPKRTSI